MSTDEQYMQRCIQLAQLGRGAVAPNPMVGAVIVYQDKIIGEGYHQSYGKAHAEVNAVNSVKNPDLLADSTIYVSLEPCAHFGKTPPCADLLVHHRFKRVVIGCLDTFSEVSGKGIERLKKAGIDVTVGVLEEACREVNKAFFTFHEKKRPFVYLKWAQSTNGKIDDHTAKSGEITWISCPESKVITHQLRSELQAILVGKNTVLKDNPSLTVRAVQGKNPIRIVLDRQLEIPETAAIFDNQAETIVLNAVKNFERDRIKGFQLHDFTPKSILNFLHSLDIQSVLIEGGAITTQAFIDAELWDEALVIVGNKHIEQGTSAPKISVVPTSQKQHFTDQLNYYKTC